MYYLLPYIPEDFSQFFFIIRDHFFYEIRVCSSVVSFSAIFHLHIVYTRGCQVFKFIVVILFYFLPSDLSADRCMYLHARIHAFVYMYTCVCHVYLCVLMYMYEFVYVSMSNHTVNHRSAETGF